MNSFDRPFWVLFLTIAIIGTITRLAIFEHNYHRGKGPGSSKGRGER